MSIMDKDLVMKPIMTDELLLKLKRNTFFGNLLTITGAQIVRVNNTEEFARHLDAYIKAKKGQKICINGLDSVYEICVEDNTLTTPPILMKQNGRTLVSLDCSMLHKDDALGFMSLLSRLPSKTVAVIKNITEIPQESTFTDNPDYVENLLLHSWHNDEISLIDKTGAPFTLLSNNYTVIILMQNNDNSAINISRMRYDCYGQVQFKESLDAWIETEFFECLDYYGKINRLSSEQLTAVKEYLAVREKGRC